MRFVALLSGGLDSTVAATLAARDGSLLLAITADYGQRAAERERKAAAAVAASLGSAHRVVSLPFLGEITTTALIDRSLPLPSPARDAIAAGGPEVEQSARAVWVPNRNGLLINVAACFAEALDADAVVVGFNREEAATFPDNSAGFLDAASGALTFSTRKPVRVVSPTARMTKDEIVRAGYAAGAPLHWIWPCYAGGRALCWTCESCLRLERALQAAGEYDRFRREHSL
ncbi:MAG: 7-cyano-7-deazaguanine synthase QueC [Planctomycetota bacterium]